MAFKLFNEMSIVCRLPVINSGCVKAIFTEEYAVCDDGLGFLIIGKPAGGTSCL